MAGMDIIRRIARQTGKTVAQIKKELDAGKMASKEKAMKAGKKEATDLGAPASTSRSGDLETKPARVETGERVKKNKDMNKAYKQAVNDAKAAENKAKFAKANNDSEAKAKFDEQATMAKNKAKDLRKKHAIQNPVEGYSKGGFVAGPNRRTKMGHTDHRSKKKK